MNAVEDSAPAGSRGGLLSAAAFAAFIIAAVFCVYYPALQGAYVWDDDQWTSLLEPVLKDFSGLWEMWKNPSVLQQYFPVTGTTFWLDYQLWHSSTVAAHAENVLLHVVSALLLWRLLFHLRVPGARIAATIFALHPVMVESVAWISERKNVLSMALFLGSMLAYGKDAAFWEEKEPAAPRRPGFFYYLALVLFSLALLAKISVFAMPAVLLLIVWWKMGRVRLREDVLPTLPFLALTLSFGYFISHWEKHHVGAQGEDFSMTFAERLLVAGRALWFYVGKLVWPAGFCPIFPRWQLDVHSVTQWLWPAGALLVVVALVLLRKRTGRGPLAAVLFYGGCLFPVLGFMDAYGMLYSFVSYRWVYVPSLSLIALAGAGLAWMAVRLKKFQTLLLAGLCVPLACVTWQDAGVYRNIETHWQATLARNPGAWVACYDLANDRFSEARFDEAIVFYKRAVDLHPSYAQAHNNLANVFIKTNRLEEAVEHLKKAVAIMPGLSASLYNLGNCLFMLNRLDEAAESFRQAIEAKPEFADAHNNLALIYFRQGRFREVLAEYRRVIEINPANADAHCNLAETLLHVNALHEALEEYENALRVNPNQGVSLARLAWIRATSRDASLRNGEEALRLARHAEELAAGKDASVLRILAAALAENKQFQEAVDTARRACDLPKLDETLHEALKADIQRYEFHLPTRS